MGKKFLVDIQKLIDNIVNLGSKTNDNQHFKSDKNSFKNVNIKIVLILIIGLVLYFSSMTGEEKKTANKPEIEPTFKMEDTSMDTFKQREEKRIQEFIKSFEGVSDAKVLLSLKCSDEKIIAADKNVKKDTIREYETATGNLLKDDLNISEEEKIIFTQDVPYVVKVNQPIANGVVIIISGSYSQVLEANIKSAMKAYLGIGINKIQVYKMKE